MTKILAIDDKIDNLITTRALLKMSFPQYDILTAESGLEGIKIAKKEQPDIILLDIIMPQMDGYETCKILKKEEETKKIAIIMVTAIDTNTDSKVKAFELGAEAFLSKPIEHIELAAQIKVILRTREAENKLIKEKDNLENLVLQRTKKLSESERKYRSLIDNSLNPILVIDNGKIVFANNIVSDIDNIDATRLINRSFIDYIFTDDQSLVKETYSNIISRKPYNKNLVFRVKNKTSKQQWYQFKTNFVEWQKKEALLVILNDITHSKEIEYLEKKYSNRNKLLLELHNISLSLNTKELYEFVLEKVISITESKIGFFHEFDNDSQMIKLGVWGKDTLKQCKIPEDKHYPINNAGNWVDCVRQKKPIICNNFQKSKNQKGLPKDHVAIDKMITIPVMLNEKIYFVFGVGNKKTDYNQDDLENMQIVSNELSKIIEKRNYEEELLFEREKYEAIHKNAPLPFQSLDANGNIIEINPAWSDVLGYQRDEVIGKWYGDFLHPEYVEIFKNSFPKLKKYGEVQNVPFKLRHRNGHYIEIRLDGSSGYDSSGNFMQTYCTFKNVSDEIIQQRKLEESERKYRSFVEQFQGIAYKGYEDWTIEFFEGNIEEITGYSENEFYKGEVVFSDLIHPDDIFSVKKDVISLMQSNKKTSNREYRIIHKNGSVHWVFESISKFNENEVKGVYGTLQDISEIKQREKELNEAKLKAEESDRLKTAFLSNMSHEIRTPMNGIIGFTDILQESDISHSDQREYLKIIQKSSIRLLNTVNDIVEISKIESGGIEINKGSVDLLLLLNNMVTFFEKECEEKGLTLSIENKGILNSISLYTDETKLNSIISNLIKNAIKYTQKGSIKTGFSMSDNHLTYYCQDTGIGIPKHRQEAIFNRFEQADVEDKDAFQGSGLGLSIVKSYVEMLEGKIWVESEKNKGSAFYVMFPSEPQKTTNQISHKLQQTKSSQWNNVNLLIAEDDEVSSLHLSMLSKKMFRNVQLVSNGLEAVSAIKNNPSINIVLMDMKMPIMDGYEATQKIREFNKDIIIIAQTAFAFEEDKKQMLKAGCNSVITKPINKENLIKTLKEYLP